MEPCKDDKENDILADSIENKPVVKNKVKRRKRKSQLGRIENVLPVSEENVTDQIICEKFDKTFDENVLHKWNQEMEQLEHLKDE